MKMVKMKFPILLLVLALIFKSPTPRETRGFDPGKIILVDNCLDQKKVSLRIAAPPAR